MAGTRLSPSDQKEKIKKSRQGAYLRTQNTIGGSQVERLGLFDGRLFALVNQANGQLTLNISGDDIQESRLA